MSDSAGEAAVPQPAARDYGVYRDPTALTNGLKVMLAVSVLLGMAALISGSMEMNLLQDLADRVVPQDEIGTRADASDSRQQLIGFAQIGWFILTGIIFLTWVYHANRNARALGATDMQCTPGWAVGWYFVPFVNLWKPYQAMREIWQASVSAGDWKSVPSSSLLGWWWALYIGSAMLNRAAVQFAKRIDGVDGAITASWIHDAAVTAGISLDVVALIMVGKITANQISQFKLAEVF
ncbi:MAG TPA: DUF4328 domain-containing protein [Dongiaceae bacterium]